MDSRFEYKYLVPNQLLDALRTELEPFMAQDAFARKQEQGQYTVKSIYYDTPSLDCYREKLEGLDIRNKFRIRGYNRYQPQSIIFLEIKHKHTNCISKSRAPLYYEHLSDILLSPSPEKYVKSFSGNGREAEDARKFLFHFHGKNLQPAVSVIYDREAFFGRFDSALRVTFDKNLRSILYPQTDRLFEERDAIPVFNDHFILEIKFFGTLPEWVRSLVSRYSLLRQAISKYTMCLEVHPEFLYQERFNGQLLGSLEEVAYV